MESYVKELYINFISLQYAHGSNKISFACEEFKQLLIVRAIAFFKTEMATPVFLKIYFTSEKR